MGRSSILVVDDSLVARRELSQALADNHDVVEADNGAAGLACARERTFDIIIADLHMPIMGGIEFVRLIRGLPEYARTPVFAVTTESNDEVITRARAAGVNVWVRKPLNREALVRAVEEALSPGMGGRRASS